MRHSERGAALIVTIVVVVILTALGLAMATFSDLEEATAAKYRDEVQIHAVADAGVRLVQLMFRNPNSSLIPRHGTAAQVTAGTADYSGTTEAQIETSLNPIGIYRTTRGAINSRYAGTNNRLFRGKFTGSWDRVFGGTYSPTADLYDLKFNCDGIAPSNCWLNTKINSVFSTQTEWNRTVGRITDISIYGPPILNGRLLGYATVRVTATKFSTSNQPVASETLEAILGVETTQPAMLADGNMKIESSSSFCGSSCEQIHANGNITLAGGNNMTGGDPVVTATGTVGVGAGSSITPPPVIGAEYIEPPPVNPWDFTFRPVGTGLNKYYLLTDRVPLAVWTDANSANNPQDYDCGMSECQDYGLEYDNASDTTPQARTATGRLYKWDETNKQWVLLQSVASGGTFTIDGWSVFQYYSFPDLTVAGTGDQAAFPFVRTKVPHSHIKITSSFQPPAGNAIHGSTLLVDMGLWVESSAGGSQLPASQPPPPLEMSFIANGTIYISSSPNINPALANKVLFASGRDVFLESSANNDFGATFCATPSMSSPPAWTDSAAAAIVAHEQLVVMGSAKLLGIIVAENEVNYDNAQDSGGFKSPDTSSSGLNTSLYLGSSASHGYKCGMPPWPFPDQGKAVILALNDAND